MPSTKSSSNWSKLQQKIATTSKPTDRKKRKRCDIDDNVRAKSNAVAQCVDSDILDRADECRCILAVNLSVVINDVA